MKRSQVVTSVWSQVFEEKDELICSGGTRRSQQACGGGLHALIETL